MGNELPNTRFYVQEAVLVPLTAKNTLQSALMQHGTIRLERGDYKTGNSLSKIVLRSNNRIYGLGNDLPEIEVEPGTTGALVSAVHCTLTFPSSNAITQDNLFRHINYSTIQINGGTLEKNLFFDTSFSKWKVDHSVNGYWRNNRVIRFLNHSASPMLTIQSRAAAKQNNSGNVFLWMNSLGASSEIMNVAGQRDIGMVFIDCESYSTSGGNALTVRDVEDLSIFGTYGSMKTGRTLDHAAVSLWLHGHQMGTYVAPTVIQRAANTGSVITHYNLDMSAPSNEANANASRFRLFTDSSSASKTLLLNEAALPASLTIAQQNALLRATSTSRTSTPWERPKFNPIPNPAGPNWNGNLAGKTSSRATIQAEIDTKGLAVLAPGIYYLDGPLVLGKGKGLVGGGMDNTVLIALNNSIDLVVGGADGGANSIVLADVTLQGGRSGIHHTTNNAQFTDMNLSHVTIRDMADSGIWLENIYAWDNNSIEFLNILNCPAGIKQRAPAGTPTDASPTLTYLDKNVFYQCQFVNCGAALDLVGNRASNGNAWVNCLFKDNTKYAAGLRSHNTAVFANCDFINNNGHPSVNVQGQLYLVSCAFEDTNSGATDFVDGIGISLEGCSFNRNGASGVVISAPNPTWIDLTNPANNNSYRNHNSFFYNCQSSNVPINLMFAGMVVNSIFPDRPDLSVRAAIVSGQGATITTLIPGTVQPADIKPQLLTGATFSSRMVSEVPDVPLVNTPPFLQSGISATPNPAVTGQNIQFFSAGSDADGDSLSYSWSFGDGSIDAGSTVSHAYAQAGNYTASVLILDGKGGALTAEIAITVAQGSNGGGTIPEGDVDGDGIPNNLDEDMDGDGVSNNNEILDGTNPLDPASMLKIPMSVLKLSGSVKFGLAEKDSLSFSGVTPGLPALFSPEGAHAKIDAGGAKAELVLDKRGKSKSTVGTFAISLKPSTRNKATKKIEFKGGNVKFKAQLLRNTWSDDWADEGIVGTQDAKISPVAIVIELALAGRVYTAFVQATFSAKAGKSGKFKK